MFHHHQSVNVLHGVDDRERGDGKNVRRSSRRTAAVGWIHRTIQKDVFVTTEKEIYDWNKLTLKEIYERSCM